MVSWALSHAPVLCNTDFNWLYVMIAKLFYAYLSALDNTFQIKNFLKLIMLITVREMQTNTKI